MSNQRIQAELARFISTAMSPLLMPFYGILIATWISPLCLLSAGQRLEVVLITLGLTCVTPVMFIAILHNLNIITDKRLIDRKERTVPYSFAAFCYLALAGYLLYTHRPQWLVMFAAGGTMTLLTTAIVNRRWKISAHAAGSAGVLAMLYQLKVLNLEVIDPRAMVFIILFSIICCGLVGSARLILKRHTLSQVFAGYANGFFWVTVLMYFFS